MAWNMKSSGSWTSPTSASYNNNANTGQSNGISTGVSNVEPTDYWSQYYEALAGNEANFTDPYASQNSQLINEATGLASSAASAANTDYTSMLNELYQKEIEQNQLDQANQFKSYGMGELALRGDVVDTWNEQAQDAATQAATEGAALQSSAYDTAANAYSTAASMLDTATGNDLDYLMAQLEVANSGSSYYTDIQSLLSALTEKLGTLGYSY